MMKINNIQHPVWANKEHTGINVTVDFEGIGEVPFFAKEMDAEEHGKEIFTRCAAGEFGTVAEFVPAP